MQTLFRLMVLLLGVAAASGSASGETPGGATRAAPTGTSFFPVESATGTVRVNQEVLGVLVQDFQLQHRRTRQGKREYRLTLRLRNVTGQPVVPTLRVLLWSGEKPAVAFDIQGDARQIRLPPKHVRRFRGDFKLDAGVRLTRLSVIPLPPHAIRVRLDQPVPLDAPPEEEVADAEGQSPPKEDSAPATDAERQRQEEWARFQEELQQLYPPEQRIPPADALGRLSGFGPYGPLYRVLEGPFRGLYIQSPTGWVPGHWLPQQVDPRQMWVDPFQ